MRPYPRNLTVAWCLLPVAGVLAIYAWWIVAGPWGAIGSAAFVGAATTAAAIARHQRNMRIAATVRANLDIIEVERWLEDQQ